MNNLDPNIYEVHEQYLRDRMRDAEQQRLIQIAKQNKPSTSIIRQGLDQVGNFLVLLGQSLQIPSTGATAINTISRPVS